MCIDISKFKALLEWRYKIDMFYPHYKVVATNGCFDILHAGHIHMLSKARSFGGFLVVGLNSDCSIKLLKGPNRPVNNEQNRKTVLESIRYVDFVNIFYNTRATFFLFAARPHIYVKSADYSLKTMDAAERVVLRSMKTQIKFVDMVHKLSTTNIIKALQ